MEIVWSRGIVVTVRSEMGARDVMIDRNTDGYMKVVCPVKTTRLWIELRMLITCRWGYRMRIGRMIELLLSRICPAKGQEFDWTKGTNRIVCPPIFRWLSSVRSDNEPVSGSRSSSCSLKTSTTDILRIRQEVNYTVRRSCAVKPHQSFIIPRRAHSGVQECPDYIKGPNR